MWPIDFVGALHCMFLVGPSWQPGGCGKVCCMGPGFVVWGVLCIALHTVDFDRRAGVVWSAVLSMVVHA